MRQSLKTLYRRKKGLSWVTVEGGVSLHSNCFPILNLYLLTLADLPDIRASTSAFFVIEVSPELSYRGSMYRSVVNCLVRITCFLKHIKRG